MRALAAPTPKPAESGPDEGLILRHFKMQQLLKVARWKVGSRKPVEKRLAWVRKKLGDMGVIWQEWIWMVDHYNSDGAVKLRVDSLFEKICGGKR